LLDYKGLVNGYLPNRAVIGLCQYDANTFSPRLVESIIAAHGAHVSDVFPSSPQYSQMSFRGGNFWVDIVPDKQTVFPNPSTTTSFSIVERAEIVGWGVAPNFDRAHAAAKRIARSAED
jgi:hypothetical protein